VAHRPLLLPQLLAETARDFPQRSALVLAVHAAGRLFTSTMTYGRLLRDVERMAASFQRLGVGKGDRVAICLPNCPQFVVAYWAALRAGAIAVPFNPLYAPREVEYQLRDSGATLAVVMDRFHPVFAGLRSRTALGRIVVTRIKEHFPPLLWLLYTLTKGRKEPSVRLGKEDLWFRDLLTEGTPKEVPAQEEETAVLLYTGGTTGISKGAELSHRNLVVNAEQNRDWASLGRGEETTLGALPLFHAFGLTCGLHVGTLTAGTLVLVPNPTDARGLAATIHRLRPTVFPVVPTLVSSLVNLPDVGSYDFSSVRVCPCAGSPLPPALQRTCRERTGIRVVEGYGLTEAAPVVMGNPPFGEDRPGTIGLPYPDTLVRVVDFETAREDVPFDGEWTIYGELVVRGPQVMKGYWGRPEETADQLREGWLRTGDIGQMHRDGYFRIVDRLKDMIIRSGMKIYPAEIEAVLHEHPKVREALVIGVPDETRGELVKAFVVPHPGVRLTGEELLEFCRRNLAKYKVPAQVEFRTELRRSAVGKPLRRALREELDAARR
jgi:long-chain acyl-CoA synthetase